MLDQVEIVRDSHFPVKVYKDFRILTKLGPLRIAPEPIFRSSVAEEKIVGTAFIAMSMVEVSHQAADCCGAIMLILRCNAHSVSMLT